MNVKKIESLKKGDVFTIGGRYKRRTFFEFLTGKKKELQKFVVIGK